MVLLCLTLRAATRSPAPTRALLCSPRPCELPPSAMFRRHQHQALVLGSMAAAHRLGVPIPTRTRRAPLQARFSMLAALTSSSTCSFHDTAPSPQLAGFPVRNRGCRRPVLVSCRAHHHRKTLRCCARPCLPSHLMCSHLQIRPRCRL
uniref:Uncharacterized protein n=1 Tax=Zea mays TaxID=4577 RepID=C0HFJ1_MAIZE|nr:unknown [Zea mays]|eukprot:NP_001159322.1 uncharacterized protein LOC100304414 [Zea mays]